MKLEGDADWMSLLLFIFLMAVAFSGEPDIVDSVNDLIRSKIESDTGE